MKKKFKIYEFDESPDFTEANRNIVKVKVSLKAEKLSKQAQKYNLKHNKAILELIRVLTKDNPDVDFQDFKYDDFGFFTGELIS